MIVIADAAAGFNVLETIRTVTVELPPPPPVAPPPQRRPPVAASPKPVAAPPALDTPATPKIVQIFSPERERQLTREYNDSMDGAQRVLEKAAGKNLTAEQRDKVAQIRDFVTQAKQAKEQDLVTAVSLASHADILAKDLLNRLP